MASRGQKVFVFDGTSSKGQPESDIITGIWLLEISGLSAGKHSFTAKALYADGGESEARTFISYHIDTPFITSVEDHNGVHIPNGGTTSQVNLITKGKAKPNTWVSMYSGEGTTNGRAYVDNSGNWRQDLGGLERNKNHRLNQRSNGLQSPYWDVFVTR